MNLSKLEMMGEARGIQEVHSMHDIARQSPVVGSKKETIYTVVERPEFTVVHSRMQKDLPFSGAYRLSDNVRGIPLSCEWACDEEEYVLDRGEIIAEGDDAEKMLKADNVPYRRSGNVFFIGNRKMNAVLVPQDYYFSIIHDHFSPTDEFSYVSSQRKPAIADRAGRIAKKLVAGFIGLGIAAAGAAFLHEPIENVKYADDAGALLYVKERLSDKRERMELLGEKDTATILALKDEIIEKGDKIFPQDLYVVYSLNNEKKIDVYAFFGDSFDVKKVNKEIDTPASLEVTRSPISAIRPEMIALVLKNAGAEERILDKTGASALEDIIGTVYLVHNYRNHDVEDIGTSTKGISSLQKLSAVEGGKMYINPEAEQKAYEQYLKILQLIAAQSDLEMPQTPSYAEPFAEARPHPTDQKEPNNMVVLNIPRIESPKPQMIDLELVTLATYEGSDGGFFWLADNYKIMKADGSCRTPASVIRDIKLSVNAGDKIRVEVDRLVRPTESPLDKYEVGCIASMTQIKSVATAVTTNHPSMEHFVKQQYGIGATESQFNSIILDSVYVPELRSTVMAIPYQGKTIGILFNTLFGMSQGEVDELDNVQSGKSLSVKAGHPTFIGDFVSDEELRARGLDELWIATTKPTVTNVPTSLL